MLVCVTVVVTSTIFKVIRIALVDITTKADKLETADRRSVGRIDKNIMYRHISISFHINYCTISRVKRPYCPSNHRQVIRLRRQMGNWCCIGQTMRQYFIIIFVFIGNLICSMSSLEQKLPNCFAKRLRLLWIEVLNTQRRPKPECSFPIIFFLSIIQPIGSWSVLHSWNTYNYQTQSRWFIS